MKGEEEAKKEQCSKRGLKISSLYVQWGPKMIDLLNSNTYINMKSLQTARTENYHNAQNSNFKQFWHPRGTSTRETLSDVNGMVEHIGWSITKT